MNTNVTLNEKKFAAEEPAAISCAPAWRAPLVLLALGLTACWLLPDQLGLLSTIFISALLVMSLDLIVGVAGLATLGHSAMFGVGAYAAGNFALHVIPDPIAGLMVGILMGGILALISGSFLLRYQGFTFLMLTVAVSQIMLSLAQKLRTFTGGDDGFSGFTIGPLLGRFNFDLEGKVAAYYALAILVVLFYIGRRLIDSPFGLAVRGIHENRARMAALGTPVFYRLLAMYTIAGAFAGAAGALSAQVNTVVGLDSLSFALSAEILVMLILGGTGRLTGALIGATIFTVLHHTASSINPYHWLFVVGLLLMTVVLVSPAKVWSLILKKIKGQQ